MCDTINLTSKLVNMMQPPNSISVSRVDPYTGQLLKPLVMLQPLPLGPYGFMEKLWPLYTNMNTTNKHEAATNCMHCLDSNPVLFTSALGAEYIRYTLDDTVFKKRHIQDMNRHIIIPTDALQTRSMICLMYEGGLYHKTQTGSHDVLRWFMLLPSSRSAELYPVEIQLQPNGILASIRTQRIHDSGYWSISFEDPSVPATYIETYTKHVADALGRSRARNHDGVSKLYAAHRIVVADQFKQQFPWTYESINDVNITTDNVDPTLLDKLRKTLGM